RDEAGAQLVQFVNGVAPDLAPWLPLLAIPFDAEVPPTPEASGLDARASLDRLHETTESFLERMLMMPTLLAFAVAHWLDHSSRYLLMHLTRKEAPRRWLVCVTTRPRAAEPAELEPPHEWIELEPLDPGDCAALAISIAAELAISSEDIA